MALTGRTALVAALGAVAAWLLPGWGGILAVALPLLAVVLLDLALAGPVRTLQLSRSGPSSVRQGEEAAVALTVTNPSGRPLRAELRAAWPPSSWAPGTSYAGSRHRLTVPAGERRRVVTLLRPTRRRSPAGTVRRCRDPA